MEATQTEQPAAAAPATQEKGIKETKEMLAGIFAVAIVIAARLKDGFQLYADGEAFASAMLTDPELKSKVAAAFDNAKDIPAELKNLSVMEIFELSKVGVEGTLDMVKHLKG